MSEKCAYITHDDIKAVCAYIDQIPSTDGHLYARVAASRWFDGVIRSRIAIPEATLQPVITFSARRAIAYRAAFEILYSQITPQTEENAYERMAVKFNRLATAELSTLTVKVGINGHSGINVNLGIATRGMYG